LAGQPTPASIDGISFLPTLLGHSDEQKQHEYLYWELARRDGFQEIRMGDWKGERLHLHDGKTPTLELYDLKTDPKEEHDVAAGHPDVVAKMERIAREAHIPDARWPLTFEEMKNAPPKLARPPGTKSSAAQASPSE
jgi:arylsulfatase A-like enzyme